MGLGHFGIQLHQAHESSNREFSIAGLKFRSPQYSLKTGKPFLKRNLKLSEILKRRDYIPAKPEQEATGCPFAVGISQHEGLPLVLLNNLEEGRVVEKPGQGLFLITNALAIELAGPGKCTPAIRQSGVNQ